MKLRKILILSLGMALFAGAGVGAALAQFSRVKATNSGTNSFDKVVNLYWGHESDSISLENVTELQKDVAQYRYLEVSPKASATVSGNVKVTFTLDLDSGVDKGSINGLTVKVYETESTMNDSTVAAAIAGKTADASLDGSTYDTEHPAPLTDDIEFAVASGETAKHYAIVINYNGAYLGDGGVVAGLVSIKQSFTAGA